MDCYIEKQHFFENDLAIKRGEESQGNPRVVKNGQEEPELRRRGEPERPESPK